MIYVKKQTFHGTVVEKSIHPGEYLIMVGTSIKRCTECGAGMIYDAEYAYLHIKSPVRNVY